MSRIGKLPIELPANVKVNIDGARVFVEGPLGKNEKIFDNSVLINLKDDAVHVSPADLQNDHSLITSLNDLFLNELIYESIE